MFKGFRWHDWLIGYLTLGVWIAIKIMKNYGISTMKIVGGIVGVAVFVIGSALIYASTDSYKASKLDLALRKNNLNDAEVVLKDNPAIKTKDGLSAVEVIEKIKANLKAEEIAQLALAEEKKATEETRVAEAAKVAEEKKTAEIVAIKQKNLVSDMGKEYADNQIQALKEMNGSFKSDNIPDQMDELRNTTSALAKTINVSNPVALKYILTINQIAKEIAKAEDGKTKSQINSMLISQLAGLTYAKVKVNDAFAILQEAKESFVKDGAGKLLIIVNNKPDGWLDDVGKGCECSTNNVSDAIGSLSNSNGSLSDTISRMMQSNSALSKEKAVEIAVCSVFEVYIRHKLGF